MRAPLLSRSHRRRRRIQIPVVINFDGDETTFFDGGWAEAGGNVTNDQIALGGELLADTGFDDAGSWTLGGESASIAGSKGVLTTSPTGTFQNDNNRSNHVWYQYSIVIDSISGGGINFKFWTTASANHTSIGAKSGAGRVLISVGTVVGVNTGTVTASIDDFSIKPFTFTSLINALKSQFGLADGFFIDVYINVATAQRQVGIIWNLDDAVTPTNFGMAYMDGAKLVVEKNVNGTYTQLASVVQAVTQDQILRVENPAGTNVITVKYNSVIKATPTLSDESVIENPGIALFSTEANNAISKVVIGKL